MATGITVSRRRGPLVAAFDADDLLLLALLQGQRESKNPEGMMQAAAAALGEHLEVDRVGFFDLLNDDELRFGEGWSAGRLPLLTGLFPPEGIGKAYLAEVRAGKTLGIEDVRRSPLTAGSVFGAIGTVSIIGAPIVRNGRWRAGLYVNHAEPRRWTAEEIELTRKVADQTWDAVERARAVAALVASEARLQAITDSIDQMIWSTRPDGFHDFYNRRWYEYTGVPEGSTDGEAWNGMFHPDDQARAWETWRHSLATGEPYHIEYRLRHKSGVYRWVLGRAQPVRDDAGNITRWFGTCTDIQEIVEAREVQSKARHDLEDAVEERTHERDQAWRFSRDLQVVIAPDGTIRMANDAWLKILGWRPNEVAGRNHLEFNHPEHAAASQEVLEKGLTTEVSAYLTRCLHKDGSYRWVSWVVAPADGVMYASGRDVTEEREAAAALEATRQQLRQSHKMEAMGQLTSGLTHDFNNLLGVLTNALEVIRKKIAPGMDRDVERCIETAQRTVQQAASLTHRLLSFARQQPLDSTPTNINERILGMEELIGRSMPASVHIDLRLQADVWTVLVDANQLESALLNLCINARDAMPEGGTLTIETANIDVEQTGVALRNLPAGNYVELRVRDSGVGIPADLAARVFDPFFTTKPAGKGTGLGLSMVYGFARQSGGQIWVDSEIGQGSAFCLCLPRYVENAGNGLGSVTTSSLILSNT